MKKLFIIIALAFVANAAWAQSKIGIKLSPTLSTNRVEIEGNAFDVDGDGIGGRFIFGPVVDLFIAENYYFNTGILFAPKRVGIEVKNKTTGLTTEEEYKLQYIQLPATLKLFTNEVALDTRVFFQLGGVFEIKIDEKDEYTSPTIEKFKFFDVGLHFGTGVEYRLSYNTMLFGGFFYNRGLVNTISKTNNIDGDLKVKNDLIGIDLGVKF